MKEKWQVVGVEDVFHNWDVPVNIMGDDFCVVPDGFAEDDSCCIGLMSSRCRFSEGVVWIGDGNMFVYFFCELGGRSFFDFVIAAKIDDGLKLQVSVYVFLLWGEF